MESFQNRLVFEFLGFSFTFWWNIANNKFKDCKVYQISFKGHGKLLNVIIFCSILVMIGRQISHIID
jgi:hypothetical protein